ncbi:hypothetical protein ABT218_10650 [Streptomyces sp. NPDC001455]|uniref:hypothetical protein n=1 Tax=unclassified Streptomyces TaxID=2593676 RepID=UPI00332A99BC
MTQTDTSHRRIRFVVPAAWYVGLVSVTSVAFDAMGQPEILAYVLLLATFLGVHLAVLALSYLPLTLLGEALDTTAPDADPSLFDSLPLFATGAVANVLLVCGFAALVRLMQRAAHRESGQ